MQTWRKNRSEAKASSSQPDAQLLMCFSEPSQRLTMMGERAVALCCLLLTPRCPGAGQTGSQSLPHRRALSARVSGGTAWVESSRLILDLETPCQQLWLGPGSWAGMTWGEVSVFLQGSLDAAIPVCYGTTFLSLPLLQRKPGKRVLPRGWDLEAILQRFLSPSCIKVLPSSDSSLQVTLDTRNY